MELLKIGETAVLENEKEYVCFETQTIDNVNYAFLMTNVRPLEIAIVEQKMNNNNDLELVFVTDEGIKEKLLENFKKSYQE